RDREEGDGDPDPKLKSEAAGIGQEGPIPGQLALDQGRDRRTGSHPEAKREHQAEEELADPLHEELARPSAGELQAAAQRAQSWSLLEQDHLVREPELAGNQGYEEHGHGQDSPQQQMDENQRGQGASHPPEDRAGPGRPVEHQSAEHQGQRDRGPGRFQEQQSRPYRRWSFGVGEDPVVQRGERGDPGGRGQPERAGPLADNQKRQIEQVEVGALANLNQRPIVRHEDAQVIQEEPRWLQGRMAIVEQSHGSGKRQASSPDELVARKPANQPLQFQDAERGQDLRGSQAGAGDQLVDADGMVVELAGQGSLLVAEAKLGRGARRNGTTGALAGPGLAGYNPIHLVVKCCRERVLKKLAGWQAESRGERCPRSHQLNRERSRRTRHSLPTTAVISVPSSAEWTGTLTTNFPKRPVRPGRPGWLPTQVSGKEVTSPPPPPLRTARESFPSCSSSLSNALCRTRLSHI